MSNEKIVEKIFTEISEKYLDEMKELCLDSIEFLENNETILDIFPCITYKNIDFNEVTKRIKVEITLF